MRTTALTAACLFVAAIAACSDVTSPVTARRGLTPEISAALARNGNASVDVLQRDHSVSSSASATIGVGGGTLSLPEAGFTLVVPAGAVNGPTNFSVRAVPGKVVAYEFEPHGTTFNVPLIATQSLGSSRSKNGAVDPASLFVGYFGAQGDINGVASSAIIREAYGLSSGNGSVSFPIFHFSGYLVATGRSDE